MKKIAAFLLTFILLFQCACSGKANEPVSPVAEPEVTEPTGESTLTVNSDTMETLGFYKDIRFFEQKLEDGKLCRVEFPMLFPESEQAKRYGLSSFIGELNASLAARAQEDFTRLVNSAKADSELQVENSGEYYSKTDLIIPRADSRVLSMLFRTESCAGLPQISLSYDCKNYDVAKGEVLALYDITADSAALTEAVRERLLYKYPKTAFFDPELLMEAYIMDLEHYIWTVDYQGVSFYFSPLTLAPYEAGSQLVDLSFDEYAHLFGLYYDRRPYAYTVPLIEGEILNFDLDQDGKSDPISLETVEEEGRITALQLNANGRELSIKATIQGLEGFMVYTGPDKNFLFVNAHTGDLYGYVAVYRLARSGITLEGMLYDTSLQAAALTAECAGIPMMTDPNHFLLGTRIPLLGTLTGVKAYAVGNTGMPESSEEYYRIYAETKLTAKLGFSTAEIDPATGRGLNNAVKIEPGTALYFLRSDGRSFVDMMTEDGRCCRLYVSGKGEGQSVNGMPVTQGFDGVKQ